MGRMKKEESAYLGERAREDFIGKAWPCAFQMRCERRQSRAFSCTSRKEAFKFQLSLTFPEPRPTRRLRLRLRMRRPPPTHSRSKPTAIMLRKRAKAIPSYYLSDGVISPPI